MLLHLNKHANQAVQTDTGGNSRWNCGVYILTADGTSLVAEDAPQRKDDDGDAA
jgi:hypothetical protein